MNLNIEGRPRKMSEVVGQNMVTETLKRQMKAGTVASSYIFEGHFGCGKTTSANILAMFANCENPEDGEPCGCCESCRNIIAGYSPDVIDINASKETRKDDIVAAINDSALYQPLGKKKVFIIDECQSLSAGAWGALLKLLEEPPEYVMFLFCTTNAEKIPPAIISRAQKFHFSAIPEQVIADTLIKICKSYGFACGEDVCLKIAHASNGAMRDAKKLLNMLADEGDFSDAAVARILFGDVSSHTGAIASALCRKSPEDIAMAIDALAQSGETDFSNAMKLVSKLLTDAMEVKYNKEASKNYTQVYGNMAAELAANSLKDLATSCDTLFKAQASLRLQNDAVTAKVALICELERGTSAAGSSADDGLADTVRKLAERVLTLENKLKDYVSQPVSKVFNEKAVIPTKAPVSFVPIDDEEYETVTLPQVKVERPEPEKRADSFTPQIYGPMEEAQFEKPMSLAATATSDARFKRVSLEDFF